MQDKGVETLLLSTFNKFKSQNTEHDTTNALILQRTVITVLLSLLPSSHEDLIKQIEKLIILPRNGELDFKVFLFHIWTSLITPSENHLTQLKQAQDIVNQIVKEVFIENQNERENKRQTKVHNQRKSQAENQSQRRDKVSPLQNDVITLLAQYLTSGSPGASEILEELAKSIDTHGASFPPLIACHITVCLLHQNAKLDEFKEKIAPYLCAYLHATRSGLKTFVIDTVLPYFYQSSVNPSTLEALWGSIVLLPDEMETLRYFFKFGSLFISAAKRDAADFHIFLDKRLWDAIRKGLTAEDSMPRKQALYLLKNIINLPESSWNKFLPWDSSKWQIFFSLYETLDESKSHLLRPIWSQIELLYPAPETTAIAPFEVDSNNDSFWLSVLFSRGLSHGNPIIRDLVLPSLLSSSPFVIQLESSFLFGDLLQTFSEISLELLDATIDKYSSSLGKFWLNYLLSFSDYDVTAQGFTSSLIEYLRDSATITTPSIIFFLESIIQLGKLHEEICKKNKFTLLLSHNSLEYLRSILECHPISESTVQNTKLYDKVLTTAIKLTDLGANTHLPSAFDFATLSRFLSAFPLSFLSSSKRFPRVLAWAARFEHLDQHHLRVVIRELKDNSNVEEASFKQSLGLLSRAFAVRPDIEMFADLVRDASSELDSKAPKLDISMELVRSILLELYLIGFDKQAKSSYNEILTPVLPSLVQYIKDQVVSFFQHMQQNNNDDYDIELHATKLQTYAAFINVVWKAFNPQLYSHLMDMFTQISSYFGDHAGTTYPITIITAAFNFWHKLGLNIPQQAWRDWGEREKIPTLVSKILKVNARSSGQSASKSNELVSSFFSHKWSLLTLLVEKSHDNSIALSSGLEKELFDSGIEVLDQADFDSLPSVYTFLHSLLFRNNIKGEIPVAFVDSVEASVSILLESAWKSFVECKRKTLPLIVSFIGLVFHPVVFRAASEQVRPYLRKAIQEFAESPRIASCVAAHICAVCASDLSLAFSFLPELMDMCLVTEPAHLFGLPPLPEYKMWTEGHGLVITALVAGLPKDSTTNEFLGQLMLALLEQNFTNAEFATREHSQHSQTNKRKVRMWVTLTALVEYLEESSPHLDKIAEKAWLALQFKNHKNIRRLIQSFMLKFLHKHTRFLTIGLFPLLDNSNLQYQVGASVVIITARVLLETQAPSLPSYWIPLFRKLVPWSFHFHHAVRTCAQVALYTLMESNVDTSALQDPSLQSMVQFLSTNKDCARLRVRQRWFALKKKEGKKEEKEGEDEGMEGEEEGEEEDVSIPMDLLEHVKKAVKEFQASMAGSEVVTKQEAEKDEAGDFQKRILPWQMLDALPQLETREMKKQRQSIIVVASLIDNTPNIAGLVRTCEIFNVEAVVIGNKKIENEAQFQRVSVSAEKWVPILEVAPNNLPLYLKDRSASGYTILGVEQTAHSESLTTYEFPDKCVLVLGQEQHGIPADVIQLLDKCVEIPQLGMIRSLNVHVSASIVVWTYTQQHLLEK